MAEDARRWMMIIIIIIIVDQWLKGS